MDVTVQIPDDLANRAVLVDAMMTLAEFEGLVNWVALHKLRSRETDTISDRRIK
jgi:hypothetical protein